MYKTENMKPTDCLKLENDNTFKGKYLRMISWWKTTLIIPPILILFTGIIGLIYCLKADLLISVYSIPYIIIFLLGTIWFKGLKKYLFKSKLNDKNAFKVCLSGILARENGYTYLVFSKDQKRHNEHFINKASSDISNKNIDLSTIKNSQATPIDNIEDTEILLTKISNGKLKKSIANTENINSIPLLYINSKNIFVILKKDQIN